MHCELFSMKKLHSRLSLFSRKEGQPSASHDSRPTTAEARRRMKSWGSWVRASAENEGELLDCDDAISLTSSKLAVGANQDGGAAGNTFLAITPQLK